MKKIILNKLETKQIVRKKMNIKSIIYILTIGILFLVNVADAATSDHFVIKVVTNYSGSSSSSSFTIPTNGIGYNYDIDWDNNGIFDDFGVTGSITHDYGAEGTYTIRIAGVFPRIYFNNSGDALKITSIEQWGTYPWDTMLKAFQGAVVLRNNASDTPNLSSCSTFSAMFMYAANIGAGTANWDWDTGTITSMAAMFKYANSFDEDISSWNFENVSTMSGMFEDAGLSTANYEALLISLKNQNLILVTDFNAGNSQYCSAQARNARINLTVFDNHDIIDGGLCDEGYFVTGWRLNDASLVNPTSVTIPTNPGQIYFYQVDWNGDGDFDDTDENNNYTGDATHDYGSLNQGLRRIKIKGLFPQIYFNNSGDRRKIINIKQWGTSRWLSMDNAFHGALNVRNIAVDEPNLSVVTSLDYMFRNASSVGTSLENGHWDWDVSTITTMDSTFLNATVFKQDLSSWNVSNLGSAFGMFGNVTLPTAIYDLLLINWDMRNLQSNVVFSAGNSIYCSQAAIDAKATMTNSDLWVITDGGECNNNQAPFITSDTLIYTAENFTFVTIISAIDPENDTLTFSIVGGDDELAFVIDSVTGELSFVMAQDFENPNSVASTNEYLVEVTVTDNSLSHSVLLTVNVVDVIEDGIFMNGFE